MSTMIPALTEPNLKTNSQTLKSKPKRQPGRLENKVPLLLHTRDADDVFVGRNNAKHLGCMQFGKTLDEIWQAAAKDDPYADWLLIKIHEQLTATQKSLRQTTQLLQAKWSNQVNYHWAELKPFHSVRPLQRWIWFLSPYGYLACDGLAEYDFILRIAATAKTIGVVLDKPYETLRDEWSKKIYAALRQSLHWKKFNITRADVDAKTTHAVAAQTHFGILPEEILLKQKRAQFAPEILFSEPQELLVNINADETILQAEVDETSVRES